MEEKMKRLRILVVRKHDGEAVKSPKNKTDSFHRISVKIANKVGTPWAFYIALIVIIVWLLTGPIAHYSDTWQLVINTGTTIVTFLMVFVIQNTQNRDGKAMQLKLDELIHHTTGARNEFVDLEDLADFELEELQVQFKEIHEKIHAKKIAKQDKEKT